MARRGRMSKEERIYILENAGKISPEELAKQTDRTPEMIREFIADHIGVRKDTASSAEFSLHKELRSSAEWTELKRQFDLDELAYFEERYATWLSQFKEDITPSESTQIFLLLKNEILMNRNLADKQRASLDMAAMQRSLDDVYRRYPDGVEMDDVDKRLITDLNKQLTALRAALSVRTKEFLELQEKHADLMKQLKATRDQRFKRVEASKDSFIEILKDLMIEDKREAEGHHMELMRLAAEKEKERLGAFHTYDDGVVDRPFLNSDTVLKENVNG